MAIEIDTDTLVDHMASPILVNSPFPLGKKGVPGRAVLRRCIAPKRFANRHDVVLAIALVGAEEL